jgi:hypothetical protein
VHSIRLSGGIDKAIKHPQNHHKNDAKEDDDDDYFSIIPRVCRVKKVIKYHKPPWMEISGS